MKRIALIMVAILILAVAVPAMAAPNFTSSGSLETSIDWNSKSGEGVTSESSLNLNFGMTMGAGDKTKAVVIFKPIEMLPFNIDEDTPGPLGGQTPTIFDRIATIGIKRAYLQTTGSFWENGPEVTTTLGDVAAYYNPLVATVDTEGISLEGIHVSNMNLAGFFGWDTTYGKIMGANVRGMAGGVELDASAVADRATDTADYALKAKVSPVENVAITSDYAKDGVNDASAVMVDADINTIPGYKIKAGYLNFEPNFDPRFHEVDYEDEDNNIVDQNRGKVGFYGSVATKIKDFDVAASAGQMENRSVGKESRKRNLGVSVGTSYKGLDITVGNNTVQDLLANEVRNYQSLDLSKDFTVMDHIINARYSYNESYSDDYEYEAAEDVHTWVHDFKATTATDIGQLKNVGLTASIQADDRETYEYGLIASYVAPNNLSFEAGYNSEDGFLVGTGMKIDF